jgi:hypothetical protein
VPKLGAPKDENPVVLIKDNDDGSYTGVYTVSARGNYEVNREHSISNMLNAIRMLCYCA